MAEIKADTEFTGSAAGWFAGLFGQCWKEPSTEGDLKFDDLEAKPKKAKKEKKSKKKDGAGSEPAEAAAAADAAAAAEKTEKAPAEKAPASSCSSRFLIDNSILQMKGTPGIAYRNSKSDADKVKSGIALARWGETVEGSDEGDGWLRVGELFLPMTYKGTPIVTPLKSTTGEVTGAVPAAPEPTTSATVEDEKPQPEKKAAEDCKGSADVAAPGAEAAACNPAAIAPECASVQVSSVAAAPAPLEVDAAEAASPLVPFQTDAQEEVETADVETEREWFLQPSVGTWLLIRPKIPEEQTTTTVEKAAEATQSFSFKEVEMEIPVKAPCVEEEAAAEFQIEMPCKALGEQRESDLEKADVPPLSAASDSIQPEVQASELQFSCSSSWQQLPSVGTWLHRPAPRALPN